MSDHYLTVADEGEARMTDRGSRFVGLAAPATSRPEAERVVAEVTSAHPDATHVVQAYRLRTDPFREYADDDGEPAGSAGTPILRVLQGRELEDVVVAVARYYGGTNLGIGGLTRAYATVGGEAVTAAGIVERVPTDAFLATVGYDDSGTVRSVLESADADFTATYEATVTFAVTVPVPAAEDLRDRLRSATRGRVEISTDG